MITDYQLFMWHFQVLSYLIYVGIVEIDDFAF